MTISQEMKMEKLPPNKSTEKMEYVRGLSKQENADFLRWRAA
jgi:hypothetical protein